MSIQVQHRRDSRTNCEVNTPAAAEFWWDTTLNALRAGTGALLGGILLAKWGRKYTVTPAQITSSQNDYNPTDLAIAERLLLTTDTNRTLTGLAGGVTDRTIVLTNKGAFKLTLADETTSTASTAANRFSFGADIIINPKGSIELEYDVAASRWLRVSGGLKLNSISEELLLTGVISPTQIAANTNDYAPTNVTLATTLRLSTDASRNLTGIVDPRDGAIKVLVNVGTNPLVLKNADAGSGAANRFDFSGDVTLSAKQSATLRYDGTDQRWKLVAQTAGSAVGAGAVTAQTLAASAIGMRIGIINGTISESRASGAVTYAIKTLAGTDATAADPVYAVFSSGAGGYVVRTISAALSLTLSSGSTIGAINSVPFRVRLVALDNAGTVVLGAVNTVSGNNIMPMLDHVPYSTTAEGGLGGADSAQVIYTAAALTSKYLCHVGFADYDSGLAAVGTWGVAPTSITVQGADTPMPGELIQDVIATYATNADLATTIPADDTIPQNTEGTQIISQLINIQGASHKIGIEFNGFGACGAGANMISAAAFFNSGPNAVAFGGSQSAASDFVGAIVVDAVHFPALKGSQTYAIRAGGQSATVRLNGISTTRRYGGVAASVLHLREFAT